MSSRGKRARNTGSSSAGGRIAFEHDEVRVFYYEHCDGKRVVAETSLDEPEDLQEVALVRPLVQNNWQCFTYEPDLNMSKGLVWEFYAHAHYREINNPGCRLSWVRGKEISYSAETIASVMGLPFYSEQTDFVTAYNNNTLNNTDYDNLKNSLFIPGKDWNYSANQIPKHVYAKNLRADVRFWVTFICHNIYPQSHINETKPHILRIAHGIVNEMQVDAAWLMSDHIFHTARESKPGSFGFPWLITKLCDAAGVDLSDDVYDLPRTARMTRKRYKSLRDIAIAEGAIVPPAPAPVPPAAPQSGLMDKISRKLSRLLRRQSRQSASMRLDRQRSILRDEQLRQHLGPTYEMPQYTEEELHILDDSSSSGDGQS